MSKKYRVLFHGLSADEDRFRSQMARLGAATEAVNRILERAPVILKQDMTREFSERYAHAIRKAGGLTEIQEQESPSESPRRAFSIISLKDFTMCPRCGLKQQKNQDCARCGFRFGIARNALEPKNVAGH